MAITKPSNKKNQNTVVAEEFINAAPDGLPQRKGVKKGKREQISLTIPTDLLNQLDEVAEKLALSRASLINLAIVRAINTENKTS